MYVYIFHIRLVGFLQIGYRDLLSRANALRVAFCLPGCSNWCARTGTPADPGGTPFPALLRLVSPSFGQSGPQYGPPLGRACVEATVPIRAKRIGLKDVSGP
jgi:hypothetical protein